MQSQGTNHRAVVTNRPGVFVCLRGVYDECADRGKSEKRNSELKRDFLCDRLSEHLSVANLFRVMMHCVAANLLVRLRVIFA